jgi:hypothetical protein
LYNSSSSSWALEMSLSAYPAARENASTQQT